MAKRKNPPVFHQPRQAGLAATSSIAAKLQRAIALHQQELWSQAEALYREILLFQPRNFDALHLLGVVQAQGGNFASAVEFIGRAIKVDPRNAAAHANLGNALRELKRPEEALASYDRALALKPAFPDALNNRGNALRDLGRPHEALASYERALRLNPDYANALLNLGNALTDLQRPQEALASYERALALSPFDAEAFLNRGNALRDLKRAAEALASYERALELRPEHADALYNRGNALSDLKRHEEALASYDRALAVRPDDAGALVNRGIALAELRRYGEALASYDLALSLMPGSADAHYDRGNALRGLSRHEEALASYDGALSLKPDHTGALYNRGMVLRDLARHRDAADCFARLAEIKPDHEYALGNLFHSQLHCCDWKQYAHHAEQISAAVGQGRCAITPFAFLAVSPSAADQLRCARIHVADRFPASRTPPGSGARFQHERIRVAYLSADFGDHPVSYLMAGVFEKHDRERFETFAISFRPEQMSEMGQRVKGAFGRFLDVSRESDAKVAALLREMEVDIAVDLMGFTGSSRTAIFADRCAPIQVNYLGFPATMGADYIDYIIADDFVVPAGSETHYAENVVSLPDCFQANDASRRIGAATPARHEVGLPESGFVFCSFNNSYKFNPAVFEVWARLLKAVPDSVLWLATDSPDVRQNLEAEAAGRGVEPRRLIFAPRLPYAEHLARFGLADLFLDTLPFNAGTTASDALWAGVPVLTCAGETLASRMAGSLLNAVGLPELVTHTLEEYEALALKLAATPAMLAAIRAKLVKNRSTCALFDTDRFCRHLESAYTAMWERHQRADAPSGFTVPLVE